MPWCTRRSRLLFRYSILRLVSGCSTSSVRESIRLSFKSSIRSTVPAGKRTSGNTVSPFWSRWSASILLAAVAGSIRSIEQCLSTSVLSFWKRWNIFICSSRNTFPVKSSRVTFSADSDGGSAVSPLFSHSTSVPRHLQVLLASFQAQGVYGN
uniref:Putative secreted protein n=1 Tax=Anopheles darlingi TaxID=43151 RepID=A0A2M4DIN4_ANODA